MDKRLGFDSWQRHKAKGTAVPVINEVPLHEDVSCA